MKKLIAVILAAALLLSLLLVLIVKAEGESDGTTDFSERHTPLMGWSSWNYFQTNISEEIIIRQINALISTGLYDCGYSFVNIDDGWQNGRDNGIVKEKERFWPNGMKYIADYAHSKGLYAGIYSDAGDTTCGWRDDEYTTDKHVGLYGHEQADLERYLGEWGFDFIKVDWCGGSSLGLDTKDQYTKIGNIIKEIEEKYNKNKIYNICCWHFPGDWVTKTADSWRIYGDIAPNFDSILLQIDAVKNITQYTSPGHVNDLDMLQVGNGMNYEEDKSHFSMWCMMSAPLLIGCDVGSISDNALEILSNKEMIEINQDPACLSAVMVYEDKNAGYEIWVKQLYSEGESAKAVAVLNRSGRDISITIDFASLGINGVSSARDLWEHRDLPVFEDKLEIFVPSHGTDVYKVKGNTEFEGDYTLSGYIDKTESEVDLSAEGDINWFVFGNSERKKGQKAVENEIGSTLYESPFTFSWTDGDSISSGSTRKGITVKAGSTVTLPVSPMTRRAKLFFSAEGEVKINASVINKINTTSLLCEKDNLYVYELTFKGTGTNRVVVSFGGDKDITLYALTLSDGGVFNGYFEITDPPAKCNLSKLGTNDWVYFGDNTYKKDIAQNRISFDFDGATTVAEGNTDIVWNDGKEVKQNSVKNMLSVKGKATLSFPINDIARTGYILAGSDTGLYLTVKFKDKVVKTLTADKGISLIEFGYFSMKAGNIEIELSSDSDIVIGFAAFSNYKADENNELILTEMAGEGLDLKSLESISRTTIGSGEYIQFEGVARLTAFDIYFKTSEAFITVTSSAGVTRQFSLNGKPYKKLRVYHNRSERLTVMLASGKPVEILGYAIIENPPVISGNLSGETYKLNVNIKADGALNARLIVAVYSPKGVMLDIKETEVKNGENVISIDNRQDENCTVKVFLWDSDNTPLTDCLTLEWTPPEVEAEVDDAIIGTLQARSLGENGAVLLDVRSEKEFEEYHLEGSINIPHTEIIRRADEKIKDRNTKIIVYCSAFKRSIQAYRTLKYMGYKNVYILGSISNWYRDFAVEFVPKGLSVIQEGDGIDIKCKGLENEEYEVFLECNGYRAKADEFKMPKQDEMLVTVSAYIRYGNTELPAGSKEFFCFDEKFIDIYASDLEWRENITGWGTTRRDKSIDGNTLSVGGVKYTKGIGTHATSRITFDIPEGAKCFVAVAGYDDEVNFDNIRCKAVFSVYIDGNPAETSDILITGETYTFVVNIPDNAESITLVTDKSFDENYYDHTDWAIAGFINE